MRKQHDEDSESRRNELMSWSLNPDLLWLVGIDPRQAEHGVVILVERPEWIF